MKRKKFSFRPFSISGRKKLKFCNLNEETQSNEKKQKTSADGSELKMRNCCNGIELHIKRRQKITRRRNLNNFYERLKGYHETSKCFFRLLSPSMKGAT